MNQSNPTMPVPASTTTLVDQAKVRSEIQAMFSKERQGFEEGVQSSELTIPRVKMLQAMSTEVQGDPKKFRQGMLVNSVTKEELPASFIPIKRMPNNWIRFNPRKKDDPNFVSEIAPGAVVWRSSDPKDPRVVAETKFGPKGEVPAAITFMNFLCYFEGSTIPLVLSFGKTSYRAGQDFLTMCYGAGGAMFSRKYRLSANQKTSNGNTFYVLAVEPAGRCSADETAIGEALYSAFGNTEIKVHEDEETPGEDSQAGDTSFHHGANA